MKLKYILGIGIFAFSMSDVYSAPVMCRQFYGGKITYVEFEAISKSASNDGSWEKALSQISPRALNIQNLNGKLAESLLVGVRQLKYKTLMALSDVYPDKYEDPRWSSFNSIKRRKAYLSVATKQLPKINKDRETLAAELDLDPQGLSFDKELGVWIVTETSGSVSGMGVRNEAIIQRGIDKIRDGGVDGYHLELLGSDNDLSRGSGNGGRYDIATQYALIPTSRANYNELVANIEPQMRTMILNKLVKNPTWNFIGKITDTPAIKEIQRFDQASSRFMFFSRFRQFLVQKGLISFEKALKNADLKSLTEEPIFGLSKNGKTMRVAGALDDNNYSRAIYTESDVQAYLNEKLSAGNYSIQKIEINGNTFVATLDLASPVKPLVPAGEPEKRHSFLEARDKILAKRKVQ